MSDRLQNTVIFVVENKSHVPLNSCGRIEKTNNHTISMENSLSQRLCRHSSALN
ncbi:hypothetical protein KIN20_017299 [Parelaphostrongylus tenuis]|uniref:Uncharacterized protein n=1 Tax=Parelaphostrongylus tenuis TaxID=148309 RepID=A0AAD5QTP6_PARTN|nr:hypothetical protein KIN20_017299 [Parelaphostrongylus tenuis]